MDQRHPFDRFRARWVLAWIPAALLLGFIPLLVLPESADSSDLSWAVYGFSVSLLLPLAPALLAWRSQVSQARLWGAALSLREARQVATLALPLVGAALISIYLTFTPLALAYPTFVNFWLFEDPLELFRLSGEHYILANCLDFVAAVVLGPIGEEFVFRGLLLSRWTRKWSPRRAAILSAIAFALLHADWIGGFVFAIVASEIYCRFGSLWAPIVLHVANNFLAWGLQVADVFGLIPVTLESASDLPGAVWLPIAGLVLLCPWLPALARQWHPRFLAPPHAA